MPQTPLSQVVATLSSSFSGSLLVPGDPGYDDARKLHNGMIDKHPALIAQCRNTADVVDAVKLALAQGLEIAIRGGGHNVAGRATVEGGLMIDLSPMRGIHVDAKKRTARVQGGATWGDVNRETQLHGLAVTGGLISTTGVAGLTLGGGIGWLMGKHGLSLDNLISVELVTAEAKVLTASAATNADLFWGLRGGGGNFGVATSFEFNLHPVGPIVTGGLVAHPFAKARDVLQYFRGVTKSPPDEFGAFSALVNAPDGSGAKMVVLVAAHCGDLAAGEATMHPLKAFGPPVMDALGPIPYSTLNTILDAGNPKGALNYWKSSFLSELSDAAIDTMIDCYARCPAPMGGMLVEHFHGAACRVAPDATAFPHRAEGYNLLVLGQWMDPAATPACTAWVRETYAAMQPFTSSGRYSNYLGDDEATDTAAAAYGVNYPRLQKIKAKYDPGNVFHLNQNIRPMA
ncbi:FAD-binding oxidoreductase [Mesorhizobium sp. KR9-304]|uniref:FAD-binding oxidoreductase n=1 Tax=Mesorhizobium sp. KR9-304 TaxID=3156614 RepID=UPI0032B340E6